MPLGGANLTLSCIDSHAFPAPSFKWSINGVELNNTDPSTAVLAVGNNQSQLALYNVQEGTFTLKCTATNSVGSRFKTITVSVLSKSQCIALFILIYMRVLTNSHSHIPRSAISDTHHSTRNTWSGREQFHSAAGLQWRTHSTDS